MLVFFFFQAEDGIRDDLVTGVQTCALPISVNDLVNANSNCNPSVDKSSYWVPTLYKDNVPVEPVITTFYYLGEGVRDDVIAQTQPLPYGLRIVAGNSKATAPDATTIARWSCLHANEAGACQD